MIDKYAEIQDRALLYNACKGILRIKIAESTALVPVQQPQEPAASPRFNFSGMGLATGAAGAAAGGAGGRWLANRLGLTADRGGWRKWLGRGLTTAGALAGGYGGYHFGKGIGLGYGEARAEAPQPQPPQQQQPPKQ